MTHDLNKFLQPWLKQNCVKCVISDLWTGIAKLFLEFFSEAWMLISNQNTLYYDFRIFVSASLFIASWEVGNVTSLVSWVVEILNFCSPLEQYAGCKVHTRDQHYWFHANPFWLYVLPSIEDEYQFATVVAHIASAQISFYRLLSHPTEHRDLVVSTRSSDSGGPGFKSRPGDRLSWLRFFLVLLSPSRHIPG
jgi:hypothetical protein